MPFVLTKASRLACAHQGTVQMVPTQTKLKVDGSPVLVDGVLIGAPIVGCTTPATASSAPCTAVVAMAVGAATRLKVDQVPVLLDTAVGTTNGVTPVPSNFWSVTTAGQTKLKSI